MATQRATWPHRGATAVPSRLLGESVLECIGNTPLLRLQRVPGDLPRLDLLAKAEWFNPGGSVKDRAAASIVNHGLRSGHLGGGRHLLDATSGNTGIAYAMLGAALGFPVTLCVPENASPERKRILRAYGAEVLYTPAADGSDGAIRKARELAAAQPDHFWYADQYSNPANWRAHYETTANEIWRQTEGRLTHFISVLGTSGTFVGATRRLRELNPGIQCISVQPDSPFHGIEGAKHMGSAIVPAIYDSTLADRDLPVSTEAAHAMVLRVAREEGILIGISGGAALAAALEVAGELDGRPAVMVMVFPDSADKYLTERFWEEGQADHDFVI